MATNTGEQVFDALLVLDYTIDITDDGKITATNGKHTLQGKIENGTIDWDAQAPVYHVLRQAYIAKLRKQISASRTTT